MTSGVANETRRSCPPRLQDEALLQELRLKQSSSSESRDNRSGQQSSLHGGGNDVDFDPGGSLRELVPSPDKSQDNGGFRGRSELDSHGGDNLAVSRKRRIASGSNLMAVMVVICNGKVRSLLCSCVGIFCVRETVAFTEEAKIHASCCWIADAQNFFRAFSCAQTLSLINIIAFYNSFLEDLQEDEQSSYALSD